MNKDEFRSQFDVLYNSIAANIAPSVDDYEKSVFLTKAQEEYVVSLYSGRGTDLSFESTEEARRYLVDITATLDFYSEDSGEENKFVEVTQTGSKYHIYKIDKSKLPNGSDTKILFITLETFQLKSSDCESIASDVFEVIPIKHDDFNRIIKNPFTGMTDRRALRVETDGGDIYLYSKQEIGKYTMTYIRRPYPIIVETQTNMENYNVSINGETKSLYLKYPERNLLISADNGEVCELNPILHQFILDKAVAYAKASFEGHAPATTKNKDS